MLYLDKYSNRRLMKGREHPHLLLSTITENLFVYAQAFEFLFNMTFLICQVVVSVLRISTYFFTVLK